MKYLSLICISSLQYNKREDIFSSFMCVQFRKQVPIVIATGNHKVINILFLKGNCRLWKLLDDKDGLETGVLLTQSEQFSGWKMAVFENYTVSQAISSAGKVALSFHYLNIFQERILIQYIEWALSVDA